MGQIFKLFTPHADRPGDRTNTTYNHISGQCFGYQQNDGAAIQVQRKPQDGSYLNNNWVHDSPKYGLRFDSPIPKSDEKSDKKSNKKSDKKSDKKPDKKSDKKSDKKENIGKNGRETSYIIILIFIICINLLFVSI